MESSRPQPYVCPVCPESVVETEDGNVVGFYGVLVKNGVPMVGDRGARELVCPNDGAKLVPVVRAAVQEINTEVTLDLTGSNGIRRLHTKPSRRGYRGGGNTAAVGVKGTP